MKDGDMACRQPAGTTGAGRRCETEPSRRSREPGRGSLRREQGPLANLGACMGVQLAEQASTGWSEMKLTVAGTFVTAWLILSVTAAGFRAGEPTLTMRHFPSSRTHKEEEKYREVQL